MAPATTTSAAVPAIVGGKAQPPGQKVPAQEGVPQIVINLPGAERGKSSGVGEVLNGVAAILWPLMALAVLMLFRHQIRSLVARLSKWKGFGTEAEFDRELQTLSREAVKATEEAALDEAPTRGAEPNDPAAAVREQVLAEAARSPRLGLMLLGAEVDKLARRMAAESGTHDQTSVREQVGRWQLELPPHTKAAYRLFSHVRNRIVHGVSATEYETLSAIDSGLSLYSALASMPLEQHIVLHPGVDIFADAELTKPLHGRGLLIEARQYGKSSTLIFPTSLTDYVPGTRLTWEWNEDRMWPEAWYRDPDTGETKHAWRSSAEFVGRDLENV